MPGRRRFRTRRSGSRPRSEWLAGLRVGRRELARWWRSREGLSSSEKGGWAHFQHRPDTEGRSRKGDQHDGHAPEHRGKPHHAVGKMVGPKDAAGDGAQAEAKPGADESAKACLDKNHAQE